MENKDLARILNHPHDHYFKNTFGKKEIARDFLESYLPKDILNILDLNTLTNQKTEYIDKKTQKLFHRFTLPSQYKRANRFYIHSV